MFCVSGIALLEQFCEEGIHLQNPTEDPNHQVTLAQKHGNPNKIKSQKKNFFSVILILEGRGGGGVDCADLYQWNENLNQI